MKVKKKQFSFLVNVTNLHTSFVYEHRVRSSRMKMKSPTYTYISLSPTHVGSVGKERTTSLQKVVYSILSADVRAVLVGDL